MSYQTSRFLIVLSVNQADELDFETKIQRYKEMIRRSRALHSVRTEYFVLFVMPYVPTYALQTPEILQYSIMEIEKAEKILQYIGAELGISADKQFLAGGNMNLQAWLYAKKLEIDKVFGYSEKFIKLLKFLGSVRHSWKQMLTEKKRVIKRAA